MLFYTITKKPWFGLVLAIILAAPMLLLNVRNSQHWGDDFSVYIQQAINLAHGQHFYTSTYVYVPGFTSSVPEAPIGFSLLLLPVYKVFGLNMYAFTFYMAAFFAAWMVTAWVFFRRYFGIATALIMLVAAFYPNFMFWLKLLVTADVPFALLLLIILLLQRKTVDDIRLNLLTGALTGLAMQLRSIGLLILVAVWLFAAYEYVITWRKNRAAADWKLSLAALMLFTAATLTVYINFSLLMFKPHQEYVSTSLEGWSLLQIPHYTAVNLKNYVACYLELFTSTDEKLRTVSFVFSYAILLLTIGGFIVKIIKRVELFDVLVICYLVFLLVVPLNADYRYIAPVHPFIAIYLFTALQFATQNVGTKYLAGLKIAFIAFMALLFTDHLKYLWHDTKNIVPGPYTEASQQTFNFIKSNVSQSDIIVFTKPRALALYTGKHTTMYNWEKEPDDNYQQLRKLPARYYLFTPGATDKNYTKLIELKSPGFKTVYKNWDFTLYEDTTVTSVPAF